MVRRVTVGWDGSTAATATLEWAARHYPGAAQIELVQVDGGGRKERERPQQDVEEAAEAFRQAHPAIDLRVVRAEGAVAEVLANRTAPDALIVLGGRGNEDRRLGHRTSTAYRVLLEAEGPVAVVPQSFRGGRDVVVGVAGRHDDPCVVLTAAKEAVARRQKLIAVHAARPLLGLGFGALPGDSMNHERDLGEVERMVDEALEPVRRAHPTLPVSRRVVRGRAADVLLAASRTAALLVLGRDDASPVDRRPVTHSSVLLSRAPVIAVPPGTDLG
jgi:nucleotide-binding universal stress UspA family protein